MSLEAPGQRNAYAVETEGLSKFFGHIAALRDVTVQVPYGQFVTIIGPNAAGKTTLIRILSTISRPSGGRVCVDGLDVQRRGAEIRRRIGVAGHWTMLYGDLSVVENLRFYGRMYRVADLEERISELVTKVELTGRQHDAVRTLSRGMQQRLSIARAILHNPSILFLDEPYTGLDERATEILNGLLHELHTRSHTILMTTHQLVRAAEMSDQVFVFLRGQVVHEANIGGLSMQDLRLIYHRYVEGRQ